MRTLCAGLLFMLSSDRCTASTPFETVFLQFPIISLSKLGQYSETDVSDLVVALQAESTSTVLDYRVLIELVDQHASPVPPLTYWVEVWYNGTQSYVDRSNALVPNAIESHQYLATTGIGGCKLCPSSTSFVSKNLSAVRHGYFLNSQDLGKYPIQSTFQSLLPNTAAEHGTLDYEITIQLTAIGATELTFNFSQVAFFEVYLNADAFDTHVVNVNNTLEVRGAPNWFTDLGSIRSVWFEIQSEAHTGACSRCNTPQREFWNGPYSNPGYFSAHGSCDNPGAGSHSGGASFNSTSAMFGDHGESIAARNVSAILEGYLPNATMMNWNSATDSGRVYRGTAEIGQFWTNLLANFNLSVCSAGADVKLNQTSGFVSWTCPRCGIKSALDMFTVDSASGYRIQNHDVVFDWPGINVDTWVSQPDALRCPNGALLPEPAALTTKLPFSNAGGNNEKLSTADDVGIMIGCAAAGAIIVIIVLFVCAGKKSRKGATKNLWYNIDDTL